MGKLSLNAGLTQIDDADDPRIEEFRHIKERDLTRGKNQFIAEGRVVLQHLIKAAQASSTQERFRILKVLVLRNRLDGILHLLEQMPAHVEIYVVDQMVMDLISGFHMHRGILALGQYLQSHEDIDVSKAKLVLVLSAISNHDNLGSIFRNASAFGVDHIFLDRQCCHPLYRKAIRVSVGTALTVNFHMGMELRDVFALLAREEFDLYGLTPQGGQKLSALNVGAKCALVLGTEGEGLESASLAQTTQVQIEQSGALDSLNVATASGIALYEFSRKLVSSGL